MSVQLGNDFNAFLQALDQHREAEFIQSISGYIVPCREPSESIADKVELIALSYLNLLIKTAQESEKDPKLKLQSDENLQKFAVSFRGYIAHHAYLGNSRRMRSKVLHWDAWFKSKVTITECSAGSSEDTQSFKSNTAVLPYEEAEKRKKQSMLVRQTFIQGMDQQTNIQLLIASTLCERIGFIFRGLYNYFVNIDTYIPTLEGEFISVEDSGIRLQEPYYQHIYEELQVFQKAMTLDPSDIIKINQHMSALYNAMDLCHSNAQFKWKNPIDPSVTAQTRKVQKQIQSLNHKDNSMLIPGLILDGKVTDALLYQIKLEENNTYSLVVIDTKISSTHQHIKYKGLRINDFTAELLRKLLITKEKPELEWIIKTLTQSSRDGYEKLDLYVQNFGSPAFLCVLGYLEYNMPPKLFQTFKIFMQDRILQAAKAFVPSIEGRCKEMLFGSVNHNPMPQLFQAAEMDLKEARALMADQSKKS